jgi:RNA polymerase sigma factor, sigma-70 family
MAGSADQELVRRFQDGDTDAFSELVRRYQDRVFTICYRWLGDREVAAEVAQDVFVAVFRSLGRFRGEARLSTWLTRITVNHCKNRRLYHRRRARDRHEPLEGLRGDDLPPRQLAHEGPGTDRKALVSEAEDALSEALAALDDDHRAIVVLRDIDGLAYEEIAELLDLPRGTVKSRLHRARAELARVLTRTLTPEDVLD